MTAARHTPRTAELPVRLVPITPAHQRRATILDRLITIGCDLIALSTKAREAYEASRQPDARCDAAVEAIDVLAFRIAQLADTTGDPLTFSLAAQIRQHCQAYRVHDRHEDGFVAQAGEAVDRIVGIVRGVNRWLTGELAKRRPAGARG